MGKGARVRIENGTGEDFNISYDNFVEVYQNGQEGSDFKSITGTINGKSNLPGGSATQYIEAESRVYTCSFDMIIQAGDAETATLNFKEYNYTWWVANPLVKLRQGTIEIKTIVTEPGAQFAIAVSIGYSANPEHWMRDVYSKIQGISLCMLPLPGSHDAMAYTGIAAVSQAQGYDIPQQLMVGFRYFDFRVKVNSGVYYGVHGPSTTDHDYTAVNPGTGNPPFIFDQIADFLKTHPNELVILNFSHFKSFGTLDPLNFIGQLELHFKDILVPRAKKATVKYGDCIIAKQQVVAIISDTGDDAGMAQDWYKDPPNTPAGKKERDDALFWVTSECFLDRYSAVKYHLGSGLHALVVQTLQDQELYLTAPTAGQQDHRDIEKFWVSQAVLDCDAVVNDGHDLNYWQAMKMNPLVVDIYESAWRNGHTWDWNGGATHPILPPNILLLDYAGSFDGFPEACIRMLK